MGYLHRGALVRPRTRKGDQYRHILRTPAAQNIGRSGTLPRRPKNRSAKNERRGAQEAIMEPLEGFVYWSCDLFLRKFVGLPKSQ